MAKKAKDEGKGLVNPPTDKDPRVTGYPTAKASAYMTPGRAYEVHSHTFESFEKRGLMTKDAPKDDI